MMIVICLLLNELVLTSSGTLFKEDAAAGMEAGFKTSVRLGEQVEDVTVIEVIIRLLSQVIMR